MFEDSDSPASKTQKCEKNERTKYRQIVVIDTPGVMDTSVVKMMTGMRSWLPMYREDQNRVLTELARVFVYAQKGLDALLLTVKFGCRFTSEDAEALKLLQSFLGEDANNYIILILTHGDQAKRNARKKKQAINVYLQEWIKQLPPWVQTFVTQISNRVLLFNNILEDYESNEYIEQLSMFIKVNTNIFIQ